jgi:hypothetical protein
MKTYTYKEGDKTVRSIYPKPDADTELAANGIIGLLVLIFMLILALNAK